MKPTAKPDVDPLSGGRMKRRTRREMMTCSGSDVSRAWGEPPESGAWTALCDGQFSVFDVLLWLRASLNGPCKVWLTTWAVGERESQGLAEWVRDGDEVRVYVDRSWPARKPQYFTALGQAIGLERMHLTETHAKVACLTDGVRFWVVRGSGNLNPNRRLEHFDCDESRELHDSVVGVLEALGVPAASSNREVAEAFAAVFGEVERASSASVRSDPFADWSPW